jgi:magnesium transporter
MQARTTTRVSLTALLGTPVTDAQGQLRGKLKDIAVNTGADGGRVAGLVLKTRAGLSIVPSHEVMETPAGTLELRTAGALVPLQDQEREQGIYLYLQQDLVDRQIGSATDRRICCAWLRSRLACAELSAASSKVFCRGRRLNLSPAALPPMGFPGNSWT